MSILLQWKNFSKKDIELGGARVKSFAVIVLTLSKLGRPMKSTTSILLASAAAVAAGSDAASSQDWKGAYAGLSYGATSGTSPSQPYV